MYVPSHPAPPSAPPHPSLPTPPFPPTLHISCSNQATTLTRMLGPCTACRCPSLPGSEAGTRGRRRRGGRIACRTGLCGKGHRRGSAAAVCAASSASDLACSHMQTNRAHKQGDARSIDSLRLATLAIMQYKQLTLASGTAGPSPADGRGDGASPCRRKSLECRRQCCWCGAEACSQPKTAYKLQLEASGTAAAAATGSGATDKEPLGGSQSICGSFSWLWTPRSPAQGQQASPRSRQVSSRHRDSRLRMSAAVL